MESTSNVPVFLVCKGCYSMPVLSLTRVLAVMYFVSKFLRCHTAVGMHIIYSKRKATWSGSRRESPRSPQEAIITN